MCASPVDKQFFLAQTFFWEGTSNAFAKKERRDPNSLEKKIKVSTKSIRKGGNVRKINEFVGLKWKCKPKVPRVGPDHRRPKLVINYKIFTLGNREEAERQFSLCLGEGGSGEEITCKNEFAERTGSPICAAPRPRDPTS